ncbi:hypothetical protein D7B24_006456 [Verticillium nonalfalfae]|uniref:Zn(2)-C6 fungal-type domain-containing protein n=1 Tax=Verticillium nonalfalfae TaxID=1051616 RepID=A0A3M9Y9L7_9PEZI|nr:uncharacterized protein D7B24_006456 [Verticillium nonalfalfae]RNJ57064.1 hypothetical protein D7B24_006456 [Verticillium nonalfalfae]
MHPSAGCLPCKLRKKKCDGAKPICRGCQRNYLVCVWPPTQQVRPPRKGGMPSSTLTIFAVEPQDHLQKHTQAKNESETARRCARLLKEDLTSIPRTLPSNGSLRPESKFLLDHYLHRTGKMASAHVGTYTPFTDALLPIAHASDMLLDSVLTFSSFHLAASSPSNTTVNTLEQQALALRSLKYGITRYSRGDEDFGIPLFLSMLLLCCVELANGGESGSSFQHLTALRKLAPNILSRLDEVPRDYKNAIVFGRELYAYFLALACICHPADTTDASVIDESASVYYEISASGYTGALFGCSDALFRLIPQAVALLNEARSIPLAILISTASPAKLSDSDQSSPFDEMAMLRSRIALLLANVSLWEAPLGVDDTFQASGRILQLALTAILLEASHWINIATQFAPHELDETTSGDFGREPASNLDRLIAPVVAEFMDLLEKLPAQSQIVTTMCWPIVVLGSYVTLPLRRNMVRDYLLGMEATFKFANMTRSRLVLEHIWSRVRTFEFDRPITISEAMIETGGRFILG